MELGNLFGSKKETPPLEVFLAVQIQEDLIKTAVWQIEDGHPQVIAFGTIQPWSDIDSLLTAVDNSLADALKSHPDLDPNRVIFGLPEAWIKDNKISSDYSPYLKNLLDKLELKAVGFVVITEAIIQQLRSQEGIPPTAIILELSLSKVNVVVVRLGKVIGREEVLRSEDLAKDVAEGLSRMNLDQLPARFLIINGSDHEAEQQLASYSWQDDLSFLHLPKVEIPDPHFSIEAISVSGGSEAARSLGIDVAPLTPVPEEEPVKDDIVMDQETVDAKIIEDSGEDLSAADFGFTSDDNPSDFTPVTEEPVELPDSQVTSPKTTNFLKNASSFRPKFTLPTLPSFSFNFSGLRTQKLKLPLIIALLALLVLTPAGVFAFYNFMGKADIHVLVAPQNLQKTFTISLSGNNPSLPSLSATTDNLEVEKTDSAPTTGEATVGDKAKGQITIFNKTDSVKTLPKGTVLATSSNLKFVLDESISVASRSSQVDENLVQTITPGKATANASAASIGTDSNIAANTSLSVATFPTSSLEGKSSVFSGGTSRTVQAVSKQDQDALLNKLTDDLKQQATSQVNATSADEKVIALDDLKITQKSFDKNVGEEATTLTLTLKAQVPLLKYQQKQLQDLILKQVSDAVPAGYTFDPSAAQVEVSSPSTNGDSVTANATVTAKLLPAINTPDYLKKLKGMSLTSANHLLETIPGFQKVKYLITPPLPFFSKTLPLKVNNLHLSIEPNP